MIRVKYRNIVNAQNYRSLTKIVRYNKPNKVFYTANLQHNI